MKPKTKTETKTKDPTIKLTQISYPSVDIFLYVLDNWRKEADGKIPYDRVQFDKNATAPFDWWSVWNNGDIVGLVAVDPRGHGNDTVYFNQIMVKPKCGYGVRITRALMFWYRRHREGEIKIMFDSTEKKVDKHYAKHFPDFTRTDNEFGGSTYTKVIQEETDIQYTDRLQDPIKDFDEDTQSVFI